MWLLALLGCPWVGAVPFEEGVQDVDGDGGIAERFGGPDCVDDNPAIADCDADRDGFRSTAVGGDDCNDSDSSIRPGGTEVCGGGDEDCDGLVDDADPGVEGQQVWYQDADSDGIGGTVEVLSCVAPAGFLAVGGDCDDSDSTIRPGLNEQCDSIDHNCDGELRVGATNPINWYEDADGDGLGGALLANSCEPPSGTAVANNTDCDDSDANATTPRNWFPDADGDNHGNTAGPAQLDCLQPDGHVSSSDDCDDQNGLRYTGAPEACDGIDNDCDNRIDDADDNVFGAPRWIIDTDGDGYGRSASSVLACNAPSDHIAPGGLEDCNDNDAAIHPGQIERCDDTGTDDDCDGLVNDDDPDYRGTEYWLDNDGDTWGAGSAVEACQAPQGYVTRDGDCNDNDAGTNPETLWFSDVDFDGFGGQGEAPFLGCQPPQGTWALNDRDCNDHNVFIHPDANEVCGSSREDENCNGSIDGDDPGLVGGVLFYPDLDGDGYPVQGVPQYDCPVAPPPYTAPDRGVFDCDDTDPAIRPFGSEILYDGIDQACNGGDDEYDRDGDGYACNTLVDARCPHPPGVGDCRDDNAAVHPDADEVWYDAIDDNCDGNLFDQDGDGFPARLPATWPVQYSALDWVVDNTMDTDRDGRPDSVELAQGTQVLIPEFDCDDSLMSGPDRHLKVSTLTAAELAAGGLQSKIDANCESVFRVPSGAFNGRFTLEGQRITLLGTTLNPTTAYRPNDASCPAGTSCFNGAVGNRDAIFEILPGVDPVFGGETKGSLTLENVVVTGGSAPSGGAISVDPGQQVRMTNVLLAHNQAGIGGAVYAGELSDVILRDSLVASNAAVQDGGALVLNGSISVVSGVRFQANASTGSAVSLFEPSVTRWEDVSFIDNDLPQLAIATADRVPQLDAVTMSWTDALPGSTAASQILIEPGGVVPVRFEDLRVIGDATALAAYGPIIVERAVLFNRESGSRPTVQGGGTLVNLSRTVLNGRMAFNGDGPITGTIEDSIFLDGAHIDAYFDEVFALTLRNNRFPTGAELQGTFQIGTCDRVVRCTDIDCFAPIPCPTASMSTPSTLLVTDHADTELFVRFGPTINPTLWDLHLPAGSPLRDAGTENALMESTDIGLYPNNP